MADVNATLGLAEIFSESIGMAFGDMVLALVVLFIAVALLFWVFRIPLGAILVMGFPLIGGLAVVAYDQALVTVYVLGLVVVGVMVFLAILQLVRSG